jgi:capsular polysaccharide transport system ATP-binding protein
MINLNNVSKYYQDGREEKIVLNNVSYAIPRNQHLGILADSRSGKSTLVRLLAGVEEPDEGVIVVNGSASWPLGFSSGFHPDLTGEENIKMIAAICNREPDSVCLFCFEMSELGQNFYLPVRQYSSGMRAALGFVLSLAMDFDIYLADEVVGVGNRLFSRKCELMLEARIENRTFVYLGRNPRSLERFCTDAAVLRDGTIIPCSDFDDANYLLMA